MATALLRPLGPANEILFDPKFLGEKAGVLDFLVRLLDTDGALLGPFFFIQVKTTSDRKKVTRESINVTFKSDHIHAARKMKVPCYVFAVDATDPQTEHVYFCGVSSTRRKEIAGVLRKHDLSFEAKKRALYDEVVGFFAATTTAHATKFSPR